MAALRCLYRRAVDDGLIAEADNPARKVANRSACQLPAGRCRYPAAEINQAAAVTGDDPELDTLLLRLHTETACRHGGALALRPDDLDPDQCLVLLREKGETVRSQPISPTLMGRLVEHGREGMRRPGGQLLRYTNGRPITSRRYNHLCTRHGRPAPGAGLRHLAGNAPAARQRRRNRPSAHQRREAGTGGQSASTPSTTLNSEAVRLIRVMRSPAAAYSSRNSSVLRSLPVRMVSICRSRK